MDKGERGMLIIGVNVGMWIIIFIILLITIFLTVYHYKDCLKVGHTKFYCITDIIK